MAAADQACQCRVGYQESALGVFDVDVIWHMVDQRAQQVTFLCQCLFRLFAVGNVARNDRFAKQRSILIG